MRDALRSSASVVLFLYFLFFLYFPSPPPPPPPPLLVPSLDCPMIREARRSRICAMCRRGFFCSLRASCCKCILSRMTPRLSECVLIMYLVYRIIQKERSKVRMFCVGVHSEGYMRRTCFRDVARASADDASSRIFRQCLSANRDKRMRDQIVVFREVSTSTFTRFK